MSEYVETGGLRWGQAFGQAANVSWPFARIRVSRERVHLTMKFWKIWNLTFDLEKSELQAIRKRHGLFSVGVQFEHRKGDYPPLPVILDLQREDALRRTPAPGLQRSRHLNNLTTSSDMR